MDSTRQQIRLTERMIAQDGIEVALSRPPSYTDDGAGGKSAPVGSLVLQPSKRRYIGGKINNRMNNLPVETFSASGEMQILRVVIIGPPGDDIRERDEFTWRGATYSVDFIDDFTLTWQTKAEASHVGT